MHAISCNKDTAFRRAKTNQIITKTFEEAKKLLPDDLDNAQEISPDNELLAQPWPGQCE